MKRINITAGDLMAQAELSESACASAVFDSLPIEGEVNTWGQEVYFSTPVDADLSRDARVDMEMGEVAYWPPGKAICIFFGATPASGSDGKPRAASSVNPIGRIVGDATAFRTLRDGQKIVLTVKS